MFIHGFNERKLWGFCILQDGPLRQRAQRAAAQRVPDSEEGQAQQRAGCIGQAIWLVDFSGLVKWLEIPEFRNIMTWHIHEYHAFSGIQDDEQQ